jgi:hypothetical protein
MMSPEKFRQIIDEGYSLDLVFLLKMIDENIDIEKYCDNTKLKALLQTLNRKGLINNDKEIAAEGKQLIGFLSSEENIKYEKKKANKEEFEKWWKEFPTTDTFVYKGKTFEGSRSMRVKKEDCKSKINKILIEGEYTIDNLIDALKLEIYQKKEQSYKTGQNKLSYMHNSLTYLNQCDYENFIELAKTTKIKEVKEEFDGVNI